MLSGAISQPITNGLLNSTFTMPATGLAHIATGLSDGSAPGAPVALSILEHAEPPEGFAGFGYKGGSLTASDGRGVLTDVFELRRAGQPPIVGVVMVRNIAAPDLAKENFARQQFLFAAMTDPEFAARVHCALVG